MTKTGWVSVVVVVVLIGLGVWYASAHMGQEPAAGGPNPSGALGTNGSPNQGNLGQPDNGTPQQPGDGTTTSQNLILGISGTTGSQYLTAYNGMTLYTYSKDTPGKSNCTGTCATNWPPYTVASAADINVSAATTGTVGTVARADGSLQVTYNGAPLYFYIKDTKPGDTTGSGVGGVWFLAKP